MDGGMDHGERAQLVQIPMTRSSVDCPAGQAIDVLVATHGAAGYHSFFMSRGASFVEVMPFHFTPQWANIYYARMLENDKKVIWVSGRGQFGQLSGVSGLKCGMQSGYLDATNA